MLLWIESRSGLVIALLGFAFCYGIAAVIFGASLIVARRPIARELKGLTTGILSPLGTIAGLLIAFLAVHVWANLDHAADDLMQEASALRESVVFSDMLPDETRQKVLAGITTYLRFVRTGDWPAMAMADATLRPLPPGVVDALHALLAYVPSSPGQHIVQQHAVAAIEKALEARRDRILLSQSAIAPIQWIVVLVLEGLILLTVALVHLDSRPAAIVSISALSTAFAATLVLLLIYDRPFAGMVTPQPVAQLETELNGH